MKTLPDNLRINAHAGFSLADIMVGMVIALLGMIVIFQVFSVSEGIKRTTTGGGDALQNGTAALFAVERTLAQAGYGMSSPPALNSTKVVITPGAATVADSLQVSYVPGWDFGSVTQNTLFPSAVPAALTTETLSLVLDASGHAQLLSTVGGVASVISDGIALMKAQYGIDMSTSTPPTCTVGSWTTTAPTNTANILAVRIAVVARSAQPEKPSVAGGACDATPVTPIPWSGGTLDLSGNYGLDTTGVNGTNEWRCYRYKTFETTVLIRNGRQPTC